MRKSNQFTKNPSGWYHTQTDIRHNKKSAEDKELTYVNELEGNIDQM